MIKIIIITIMKCTEQRHTQAFNFTKDFWKWMNGYFAEDFTFPNNDDNWYPGIHSDFIWKTLPQLW